MSVAVVSSPFSFIVPLARAVDLFSLSEIRVYIQPRNQHTGQEGKATIITKTQQTNKNQVN